MTPEHTESDTHKLTFELETRQISGRRKMADLLIKDEGRIVGVVRPESRSPFQSIAEARAWAKEETEYLQSSRLYIIQITPTNIEAGQAHSCEYCAIAQALWTRQKELNISPGNWSLEVDSYGPFRSRGGIILRTSGPRDRGKCWHIPADSMPLIVTHYRRDKKSLWYAEGMQEWTLQFEEAHDDRGLTRAELKKKNGDARPTPFPGPGVFVLNASEFEPFEE